MDRPVIGFLTDFGLDGAAAICRGVMLSIARDAQIVDISHTVAEVRDRATAPTCSRAAVPWLPVGVHVAVVDPGVGHGAAPDRRPDGRAATSSSARTTACSSPPRSASAASPKPASSTTATGCCRRRAATFHGRDLFAPVAAHLAIGGAFADVGPAIDPGTLVRLPSPTATVEDGPARDRRRPTSTRSATSGSRAAPADLAAALGDVEPGTRLELELSSTTRRRATSTPAGSRTFGDAAAGELLLYEDSSGNLALAVSSGDAASRLGSARERESASRRA